MSEISFGSKLSLKQAAQLIMAVPENRFLVRGEMGTGKSAMLDYFREHPAMSHYLIADPLDAQTLDLGDTAMPVVDKERMVTNYAPNSRFKISEAIAANRPVVIMLDEFGKAMAPVQNMLHPLLEVRARLGDLYLPEGSIVYATSNLAGESVGDTFKMHTINRMSVIEVAKPTAEQWIEWGVMTGKIDPVVLAFVICSTRLRWSLGLRVPSVRLPPATCRRSLPIRTSCLAGRPSSTTLNTRWSPTAPVPVRC